MQSRRGVNSKMLRLLLLRRVIKFAGSGAPAGSTTPSPASWHPLASASARLCFHERDSHPPQLHKASQPSRLDFLSLHVRLRRRERQLSPELQVLQKPAGPLEALHSAMWTDDFSDPTGRHERKPCHKRSNASEPQQRGRSRWGQQESEGEICNAPGGTQRGPGEARGPLLGKGAPRPPGPPWRAPRTATPARGT